MRLLVLAAVRNYQSRAPFPMAMLPNVTRVFLLQTTIRARHSRSSVSARSCSARRLHQIYPVQEFGQRPENQSNGRLRQLTVLCTAAFGPHSKMSRGPSPDLSSRTFFLFHHAGDKLFVPTVNRHSAIPKFSVLCVECVAGKLSAL